MQKAKTLREENRGGSTDTLKQVVFIINKSRKKLIVKLWYCSVLIYLEDMCDFWLGHRERGKWKNSEVIFSYT